MWPEAPKADGHFTLIREVSSGRLALSGAFLLHASISCTTCTRTELAGRSMGKNILQIRSVNVLVQARTLADGWFCKIQMLSDRAGCSHGGMSVCSSKPLLCHCSMRQMLAQNHTEHLQGINQSMQESRNLFQFTLIPASVGDG